MFDRSRVVSVAAVLSLLSLVSLAGCTTTTTPNTPIASPAQSSTAPTGPATNATAATSTSTSATTSTTASDDQLAIDAVQRYYAAFNKALTTLNTTEMRKLFQPGCLVCEKDSSTLDRMARDGERVTGGATILSNFIPTLRSGNLLGLRADSYSERMIIKNAAGTVLVDEQPARGTKIFTVVRIGDTWILEGIT